MHTLVALERSRLFRKIILVVAAANVDWIGNQFLKDHHLGFNTDIQVVTGGESRTASVFEGLKLVKDCEFVAIHDGARPCVESQLLIRLLAHAEKFGSAIPGVKVRDTIKAVDATGRASYQYCRS